MADGCLELEIEANDDGEIGVAFRFADQRHHYQYAMDKVQNLHYLARRDGNRIEMLAKSDPGYEPGRWHKIRIVLDGPKITTYLDGEKDLEATDGTFPQGTIALYSKHSAGTRFRRIRWKNDDTRDQAGESKKP